mmetsp:Transcript_134403/g.287516  ORF Transcript_134403/g.287516 Transcript_134403/m.287516 type:complete len:617 (-) Transcript_134403:76-1926(-)
MAPWQEGALRLEYVGANAETAEDSSSELLLTGGGGVAGSATGRAWRRRSLAAGIGASLLAACVVAAALRAGVAQLSPRAQADGLVTLDAQTEDARMDAMLFDAPGNEQDMSRTSLDQDGQAAPPVVDMAPPPPPPPPVAIDDAPKAQVSRSIDDINAQTLNWAQNVEDIAQGRTPSTNKASPKREEVHSETEDVAAKPAALDVAKVEAQLGLKLPVSNSPPHSQLGDAASNVEAAHKSPQEVAENIQDSATSAAESSATAINDWAHQIEGDNMLNEDEKTTAQTTRAPAEAEVDAEKNGGGLAGLLDQVDAVPVPAPAPASPARPPSGKQWAKQVENMLKSPVATTNPPASKPTATLDATDIAETADMPKTPAPDTPSAIAEAVAKQKVHGGLAWAHKMMGLLSGSKDSTADSSTSPDATAIPTSDADLALTTKGQLNAISSKQGGDKEEAEEADDAEENALNCEPDEERFGRLCYKKCSLLTNSKFPFRESAITCCKTKPCTFGGTTTRLSICGGWDVSGDMFGRSACPHTPGGCLANEELHMGMCYKKCSILTNGEYTHRMAAATCCKSKGISCFFFPNIKTRSSFAVGGGKGDNKTSTPSQAHLPMKALLKKR